MPDIPSWVLPLLGIILGGGGIGGAYLGWRSESRKGPIERSAAQIADAVAVSNAAKGLVETVALRLKAQDDRAGSQDVQIEALRKDLSATSSRLDRIHFVWTSWYFDLKEDWEIHRIKEEAPPPPKLEGI